MQLRRIRVLSDGRPGHENQSIGLADAVRRRTGAEVEVVRFPADAGLWRRCALARAMGAAGESGAPQLVIGAGHGTHLPLLAAARKFGAKSVVIMKPSLPSWLFDLCLVPRHDLKAPADRGRVVATRGALNRIAEEPPAKTDTGVILIGGPSKHHGWDGEALAAGIREVAASRPGLAWTIGDSRRTPEGFLDALKVDASVNVTKVPHQQTAPGWLPRVLGEAREAWVTEDSVSMIFEAVTAGARTGVLPMPVKNPSARTVKAVRDLREGGYVRRLAELAETAAGRETPPRLHETARCAEVVLKRFF